MEPIAIVIFVIVGLITTAAIVAAIVVALKSGTVQSETGEPLPPPRTIVYTTITLTGANRTSQTLRGSSTASVSKTIGKGAGNGKVITTLAELSSLSSGTPVRVTGRLSEQNPPLEHNLVVYICEEFNGLDDDSNPCWGAVNTATPPLLLEVDDGTIAVVNEGYGLTVKVKEHTINGHVQGRPMYIPQVDEFLCDELQGVSSRRFCGAEVGDEVTITGTVTQTDDGAGISAHNLTISR